VDLLEMANTVGRRLSPGASLAHSRVPFSDRPGFQFSRAWLLADGRGHRHRAADEQVLLKRSEFSLVYHCAKLMPLKVVIGNVIHDLTEGLRYTLAMRSEKATVALRVVKAIAAHDLVSEHDAFHVRFWVSPEEALLPLDEIARRMKLN